MEQYSVLMSVYQGDNPDYLLLSLESMINQTLVPSEIVLVKDGQLTKELDRVIEDIASRFNSLKIVSLERNVGLGLALNEGLKHCESDLVARMDADDYSLPNRCEEQVKLFMSNPNLVVTSCSVEEFVDELSNVVGYRTLPITNEEIYRFAKRRDPFNHPSTMYRKTKVLEVGGYGNYRKNQDTDLWIKLLSNNVECYNTNIPLVKFRFDEQTYKKRKSWLNTKILINLRYKAWREGFNSFWDFLFVAGTQLGIYILPIEFQRIIYKKMLRDRG